MTYYIKKSLNQLNNKTICGILDMLVIRLAGEFDVLSRLASMKDRRLTVKL